MSENVRVSFSGPLLSRDAQRIARRSIGRVVSAVAAQGKREVQADLTKGHGKDSGEYRRGIRRKLAKDKLSARVFATDARKAAWLEGTSKLNRRGKFKGYGVFRSATGRLQRSGSGERVMAKIIKDLGG